MKQSVFTILYFTVGIVFIVLEAIKGTSMFYVSLGAKALIIPLLMVYYHSQIKVRYTSFHRIMMFAFFFSWIGDVMLQFANEGFELYFSPDSFFIFGLGGFLITQLLYTLAFSLPKGKNLIFNKRIYQTILVLAYGFLLMWLLYNKLGDFKIPVIIYAIIIHAMLLSALNRYGKVNGVSYIVVVVGALLFLASDSMIAINKFLEKFDFARVLIMSTYITAQYLIAIGSLKQDLIKTDNGEEIKN